MGGKWSIFSNGLKLNHRNSPFIWGLQKTQSCRSAAVVRTEPNGAIFPEVLIITSLAPTKYESIRILPEQNIEVLPPKWKWWFFCFYRESSPQNVTTKLKIEDGLRARSGQTWLALLWWLRTRTGAARFGPDRESATCTGAARFGPDRESAVVYLGGFSGLWGLRDMLRYSGNLPLTFLSWAKPPALK